MESKRSFYLTTFLIGLGFFTMGMMDPLYDSFVPIFLQKYISSKGIIGSIMTIDNIFAIFLIPIVSAISDRTRTPIGRRMPYILVTLPMSALFFALIPFGYLKSLAALIIVVFLLNIFKQSARGPVVALMPDTVPADYRSEANGVINTMGGIATIIGSLFLAKLMDLSINLPLIGNSKDKLPFIIAGFLVILATIILFFTVKEKSREDSEKKISIGKSLKLIFGSEEKSAILILFSLLFWFLGYQGVLPFVTMYAMQFIGVSKGTAGISPGMVGLAYAIFAIPAGIAAHKIGRKKTISISLICIFIIILLIFFSKPFVDAMNISQLIHLFIFWGLLFLFGIFWVSVITNSFPMLWQMATYSDMGIYTGLYYTFSQTAAILAPPIAGFLMDWLGFRVVFIYTAICMLIAFILMQFVKKGEPEKA
ncbi:MAG: MFS transporter [Exilispira sp.]